MGESLTKPNRARTLASRLDRVYRGLWGELYRGDAEDLRQHEGELLSHVPLNGGVTLRSLSEHMLLPKSTTSVLVQDLERRGFIKRRRREANQRELSITLTQTGARRVAESTVLDTARLAKILEGLDAADLQATLETLERIVNSSRQHGSQIQASRTR